MSQDRRRLQGNPEASWPGKARAWRPSRCWAPRRGVRDQRTQFYRARARREPSSTWPATSRNRPGSGCRPTAHFSAWWRQDTDETIWYYWDRYGRLVGYDLLTRRLHRQPGAEGICPGYRRGGDRFNNPGRRAPSDPRDGDDGLSWWTSSDATAKPLLPRAQDDPILAVEERHGLRGRMGAHGRGHKQSI